MNHVKAFGPSFPGDFPAEMRRQLWPLCCGASILSGFKNVKLLTVKQLAEDIEYVCTEPRPDFQVYGFESIKPPLTWLTLNREQMESIKIMTAIGDAHFKLVGTAKPRGYIQGFYLRDTSQTWKNAMKAGQ